jgi:hypothetical protein
VSFFALDSRRLGKGGICWRDVSVGWLDGGSVSFAFLLLTRTPTKPVTTSKIPTIISQCGNPNDAIMSLAHLLSEATGCGDGQFLEGCPLGLPYVVYRADNAT